LAPSGGVNGTSFLFFKNFPREMEMTINRRHIMTMLRPKLGFFGAFSGRFGIFRANVVISHLLKSWKISMTLEA